MFQVFREVGNTILFCLLLEKAMSQEEIFDVVQGSPFLGQYPKPYIREDQSAEMVKQQLEQQYASVQLQPLVTKFGTTAQKFIADESVLLTKERLCIGLTLFEVVMRKTKSFLKDVLWTGPLPTNGHEHRRMSGVSPHLECRPVCVLYPAASRTAHCRGVLW